MRLHTYVGANPEAVVRTAAVRTTENSHFSKEQGRTVSGNLRVGQISFNSGSENVALM